MLHEDAGIALGNAGSQPVCWSDHIRHRRGDKRTAHHVNCTGWHRLAVCLLHCMPGLLLLLLLGPGTRPNHGHVLLH
jgi:hypothetical protein